MLNFPYGSQDPTQVFMLTYKSSCLRESSFQTLFEIVLLVPQTGLKFMNLSSPLALASHTAKIEGMSQPSSRIEALQDAKTLEMSDVENCTTL